jgi:transposase
LLLAGLSVRQILPAHDHLTIVAAPTSRSVLCPVCGKRSARRHSRYLRTLSDLPHQGRVARLQVWVRRFRCDTASCPRRIFAERLPELAPVQARRTSRLADSQRRIGLSLGGEPGARLATALAMPASGDTILRLIRAVTLVPAPPPRVIGIDEWAYRRGLRYGTILCDLERGTIIDLLPDRTAETVAAWLRRHPGVTVIARDRASVYADAIRQGAPDARQVADRWHLLRNLGDALRGVATRHRKAIKVATSSVAAALFPACKTAMVPKETQLHALRRSRREQRRDRYSEIQRLRASGVPPRLIAPGLGVSKRTIERWLAAGGEPQHRRPPPIGLLRPFEAELERRWRKGCRDVGSLHKALLSRGFTGSVRTVRRWAAARRAASPVNPALQAAHVTAAWPPPSHRRCAWLLGMDSQRIKGAERTFIDKLYEIAPALAAASDLAKRFTAMLRARDASGFDEWLTAATHSELARFATGIARDVAAVRAGIVEPWSTSPVEGQINRLKTIKRQMYGRAHYDLLRSRILAAA